MANHPHTFQSTEHPHIQIRPSGEAVSQWSRCLVGHQAHRAMATGGEEEGSGGGRRRSSRRSKGGWTATTKEGVWAARLQLLPEGDEERWVGGWVLGTGMVVRGSVECGTTTGGGRGLSKQG